GRGRRGRAHRQWIPRDPARLLCPRLSRTHRAEDRGGPAQDHGLLRRGAGAGDCRSRPRPLRRPRADLHERQHSRRARPGAGPGQRARLMDEQAGGLGLSSIQEINHLPREMAEALYLRLVPEDLLERFRIDPRTLTGPEGTRLVQITAPEDKPWARGEVRSSTQDRDPALLVDVETSPLSLPELAFVQITDPAAARDGIDRALRGRDARSRRGSTAPRRSACRKRVARCAAGAGRSTTGSREAPGAV